ncbi:hypothetical protein PENTCL1PPCAC_12474 [Pristionchus entomophagus]|uniref:PHD-type domain-containing protein n=1 Tax=Pristionchus entomophagus TaxID=358040 RepID=A0AAV5T9A5_9BILA|nr:hypothetical protein PENTCL1PPCAC_12474 [Pristionchus entomophagus]
MRRMKHERDGSESQNGMDINEMMNCGDDVFDFDTFLDDEDDFLTVLDALDFVNDDTERSQPKPEVDEEGGSQQQPQSSQQPMQHPHPVGFPQGMGHNGMMIKQEPGIMHPHHMMHHPHGAMMGHGGMMIKQEPGLMRPESSMSGGSLMAAAVGAAHAGERISTGTQAATERWEEDEPLGDKATKAAVLYVNIAFPDLKMRMPDWSERAKFIHKTWRGLSSEERQVYVQKARHNRAQREKVPRPRGPRQPQLGVSAAGPSGLTAGQVAMRMTGAGAGPGASFGMPNAIGNARGAMPVLAQQPPSIDHLPPDLQQQYMKMRKDTVEFSQKQETLEKELQAIRTTKKKLGAKLRQIQKVQTGHALAAAQAAAEAAGVPPPTEVPTVGDLTVTEKETYENAQNQTAGAVKALDDAKRDYKSHLTTIHTFEMSHRIMSEYVIAHQQTSGASGSSSNGPTVGGMLSATMGGRQGMGMGMNGPHGYQQMVVPQQVPFGQMMGQERTFQLGNIGGGAMMGSRMGPMARWPPALMRSPSLGPVRYDQIQTAEERDIYECLDEMIGRIVYDIDGPPPMMQPPQQMGGFPGGGPSLKRMLDPMAPPLIMPPMAQEYFKGDDGAPKQKKKRTIQKKATNVPGGNDYDSCVERMRNALAACPPLTRKLVEPVARNESCLFTQLGMSELERFQDTKATLGNLTLSFVQDPYKDIRRFSPPAEVSMAKLMPAARLSILQQMCHPSLSCASPSTPLMVRDEGDSSAPSTSMGTANAPGAVGDVIRNLVNGVEKRRGVLRCLTKALEGSSFPPTDPHRIAFKEAKREEDEEVEIAIEIEERAPGPSGGEIYFQMSSSNSTSSQACRDEITKALLQKLQQMLEIKKPTEDYQMDTPPQSPTGIEPQMDMKPTPFGFPSLRCRMCEQNISGGMTTTGVKQSMSLLGLTPSDDGKDDSVTFCTLKCYYMFVANVKVALSPEQLAQAERHVDVHTYSRLKQISADSFARCINQSSMARVKPELTVGAALAAGLGSAAASLVGGGGGGATPTAGPPPPTPIGGMGGGGGGGTPDVTFPSLLDDPTPRKENVHVIRCSELAQLADSGRKERARAIGEDWKKYDQSTLETFLKIHRHKKELAAAPKMGIEFPNTTFDQRKCVLCFAVGDGDPNQGGRLLNYDAGQWIHANCALWSSEVYENASGALVNVERAIIRGSMSYCVLCGCVGATLQCYKVDCLKKFHFSCANKCFGKFLKDKTFICPTHSDVHCEALAALEPLRRLYIPRDENKMLAKLFEHDGPRMILRLGAFTFLKLGQLLPEQLKTCHSSRYIFPLGYSAQRMYWSPLDARKRVKYTLSITEHEGKPVFCVTMPPLRDDLVGAAIQGQPSASQPIEWRSPSAKEAWEAVLKGVNSVRARSHSVGVVLRSTTATMEPESLFGLGEGVITKMTESLPGVDTLYSYSFRHGGQPVLELPLAENPSGCARCEPRMRTLIKSHRRPVPSSGNKASSSGGGAGKSLYEELQVRICY